MSKKKVIFYLGNIRSGTTFIANLLRKNVRDLKALHEPLPDMFGRPIMYHLLNEKEKINNFFKIKKFLINLFPQKNYFEANHAFLKSFAEPAIESFSELKLLHLIRNPVEVAVSAVNRKIYTEKYIPYEFLTCYKYQGEKYWRWTFTGKEEIYSYFDIKRLSWFQWYVLEWIEVENRAMHFLDKYQKHHDCFTMHSPYELINPEKIRALCDFFELELKNSQIDFRQKQNPNHCPTEISKADYQEFSQVLEQLPGKYLEIFKQKPYKDYDWSSMLR